MTVISRKITPPEKQLTGGVTGEVECLLLVTRGEMKRIELQEALGLRHEDYFREAYLVPALAAGLIEMTIPDKPRRKGETDFESGYLNEVSYN